MTEKQTRVAIVAVVLVVLLAAAKLYRDAHRYSYPRPGERVDNYTGQVCRLNPRAGWEDAFIAMAKKNDDELLDGEENISHSWDEEEWQW